MVRRCGTAPPPSPRHAEILLLLQHYPEGLGTEQLATLLSDEGLGAVTVRAEISRLRRDLGDVVASRPYRLTVQLASDIDDVRQAVASGDLTGAIRALGRGGLSPNPTLRASPNCSTNSARTCARACS